MYWYEILATQTRLVCVTFHNLVIGNGYCMEKKEAAKVQRNLKMLGFELWIVPKHSKQLGFTWKFYHNN